MRIYSIPRVTPFFLTLPVALGSCNIHKENLQEKPNIIIIYTDDVGYGDIGCYGGSLVSTPNIDNLAANGLKFTNSYAASATSTPSRYALLTGEYYWRKPPGWRVGDLEGTSIAPGDAGMIIDTGILTLPSILGDAGYVNAVVGKWHLGLGPLGGPDWNGVITPGPEDIGFDYSFLIPATGDRVPCVYVENRRIVNLDPDDPLEVSFNQPIGDDLTIYNPDVTPEIITSYPKPGESRISKEREDVKMHPSFGHDQTIINGIPRIGYMTGGYAARWKDEDMADVITKKAVNFIRENQNNRFFLYFSTHDIHVPRVPHERFVGKSEIGVYGDVIKQMDWCVGEIMNTLDELNLREKTLVIFTSDNGPVLDDGYHDGSPEETVGHLPAGPFRGGKYSAFEGGTKVPFIVHWPARVQPGISTALFSQIDILATFASLIGHENPDNITYDGSDQLPALLGKDPKGREYVIQQNMGGTLSVVKGQWKYIEHSDGPALNPYTTPNIELGNFPSHQLYNLETDITEKIDLANDNYEKVREMSGILETIRNMD